VKRRSLVSRLAGFAGLWLMAAGSVGAQTWPSKPIRLIVPFAPGGPTDIMGRTVGKIIGDALGQPVVVENRAGAGGNIGTDVVAKAAPDGYTLAIGPVSSLAMAPGLYPKLPYDPGKDLAPITLVGVTVPVIVAHPSAPFLNFAEMVAYAKANPGKLSYATPGVGTLSHLASESLQSRAGFSLNHVPYKGTGPAAQDLLAGTVPLSFESSLTTAAQNVKSGKLRGIAVLSKKRSPLLPEVPTLAESGFPDFDVLTWFGLVGPAGLPQDVVNKLNRVVVAGLKTPEVAERFAAIGAEPRPMTPEQFGAYIRAETQRWAKVIKAGDIKPE